LILPKKGNYKNHLFRSQVLRVKLAYELMQEFCTEEYQLPKLYLEHLEKQGVLGRLLYIVPLLSAGSATGNLKPNSRDLVAAWERAVDLDESKLTPAQKEAERIKQPPYMLKDHIFNILKFRKSEEDDAVASEFVKTHSKGFFAKLLS